MVNETRIIFGGWYQRTTLHLSEVHIFLSRGEARSEDLSPVMLKKLRKKLDLKSVERKPGYLEYLLITTKSGIEIKYFEDGLYILSKEGNRVLDIQKEIRNYFEDAFNPALNYLFSLGAPTPKILANLKENHPFVIGEISKDPLKYSMDPILGKPYLKTSSTGISVLKSPENIVIVVSPSRKKELDVLTEMQIFFSDFKLQLQRYLDIHRKIWEDISAIKEKKFVKGEDISDHRARLDSYQKTINLIKNRINQMDSYARTRASISQKEGIDRKLDELFRYRFEDLFNTLNYIKEIWSMTQSYVNSAIQIMVELENRSSDKGLQSIQFLVGFGVIMGLIQYFQPGSIPNIDVNMIPLVLVITFIAFILDWTIKYINKKKEYRVTFVERDKQI